MFKLEFIHPRFWLSWIFFGFLALIARLPFSIAVRIGEGLGWVLYQFGGFRCETAQINLKLCFPDYDDLTRERLVREHFRFLGVSAIETALCWFSPKKKLQKLLKEIEGEKYLIQALEAGQGVILLSCHFTHLEMGGTLLSTQYPVAAVYEPIKRDALFEAVMLGSRNTNTGGRTISRADTRGMFRALRDNLPLWYAPDQNYKGQFAVFAPFFGIQASTNIATSRLSKISKAPVLPFFQERLEDGSGYRLIIKAPLEDFPGETLDGDAKRINLAFEGEIRKRPAEYLWIHRRFKTRPKGEEKIYPKKRYPWFMFK